SLVMTLDWELASELLTASAAELAVVPVCPKAAVLHRTSAESIKRFMDISSEVNTSRYCRIILYLLTNCRIRQSPGLRPHPLRHPRRPFLRAPGTRWKGLYSCCPIPTRSMTLTF